MLCCVIRTGTFIGHRWWFWLMLLFWSPQLKVSTMNDDDDDRRTTQKSNAHQTINGGAPRRVHPFFILPMFLPSLLGDELPLRARLACDHTGRRVFVRCEYLRLLFMCGSVDQSPVQVFGCPNTTGRWRQFHIQPPRVR